MPAFNTETILVGLAAIAVTLLVWGLGGLVTAIMPSRQRRVQERITGGASGGGGGDAQAAEAIYILNKRPESFRTQQYQKLSGYEKRLQLLYPDTSLPRFAALCAGVGAVFGIVVAALLGPMLGLVAGAAAGLLPVMVVSARLNKRERILADQLVDALDFTARVLRAGHSLATALQMCSEELPEPIAAEFRRCYDHHALGRSMDESLIAMAARMDLTDFNFFVTSVIIQRQTGGDLAEILDNISAMIRNRSRLQQQVKALTSEGRATGYVLAALPVFMFVILEFINPSYAGQLLFTPMGRMMLGVALGLLLLGLYLIKRIVTIKV
jgi:tight adherence protein B